LTNERERMIVDWFYEDGEWDKPNLYLRTRDKDGVLKETIIPPWGKGYIRPFCWIPVDTPEWKLNRLRNRHPTATIRRNKVAEGIDGKAIMRVEVDKPNDLWEIKDLMDTYEADLNYLDQVLLELYPDKIPEFHPRVWHFDLEWDPKEDFTTVMAVVDSHAKHPVVFAWKPSITTMQVNWIEREGGYMLHEFGSEAAMHEAFLQHMDVCNPDILVAHAIMWADLPHLVRRLENPDRLSPLRRVTRPFKTNDGYKDTQQPIKGRLCWDSAAHWKSGSGFETLWQKSGRGQLPNRKLNTIAELLELGSKLTEEVEGMTVHNGWYEYYDSFVDYCLRDTTLLASISQRLYAIEFFVAMQQLCGVSWASTHKVTRYFRGLVGRRTDKKALTARNIAREHMEAAYIPKPVKGRHAGVAIVDYASLYPNIILSDNLCYTTKRKAPGPGIKTLGNGTHWDQTKKGLLPSIVEEMLDLRKRYKRMMREATSPEEKLGYDMLQMAAKVAVNALYGMCGMKALQGMWVDNDIASSITFRGREAIRHLLTESEEQGYKSLFGHTDSAFIQVPFEEAEALAKHLTTTAQSKLQLSHMDVELEAYFDYWTTAGVKNRYFGYKVWPENAKGQLKVSGYEIKASSSAPITKQVQGTAMRLIGHGAEEQEVSEALREMSLQVKNGTIPLSDVVMSTRLTKDPYSYESPTPGAKAAMYYNEHVGGEAWKKGDSVSWTYVKGFKEGVADYFTFKDEKRPAAFVAFRDEKELENYIVDWDKVLDVLVKSKLTRLYESLDWDIKTAAGDVVPKTYW
jgi:DNA polymerase elongation subunit (family B)